MGRSHRRVANLLLLAVAGCGGTVASVNFPSLPDPGPSKAETFEQWDARVNPATTQATTQATQPATQSTTQAVTQPTTVPSPGTPGEG